MYNIYIDIHISYMTIEGRRGGPGGDGSRAARRARGAQGACGGGPIVDQPTLREATRYSTIYQRFEWRFWKHRSVKVSKLSEACRLKHMCLGLLQMLLIL